MCAKWNKNVKGRVFCADISYVVGVIEKARKPGNEASFKNSSEFMECRILLAESVNFSPEIPGFIGRRLVSDAKFAIAKKNKPITKESLIAAINKAEKDFLEKSKSLYWLLTRLYIELPPSLSRMKIENSTISFSAAPFPGFGEHKGVNATIKRESEKNTPRFGITHVQIATRARTDFEAGQQSMDNWSLLMGMWNFALNRYSLSRMSGGYPTHPVNEIRSGPLYTLYDRKKDPTTGAYWHEKDLLRGVRTKRLGDKWGHVSQHTDAVRRALKKHKYKAELVDIFRRYHGALDEKEFEASCLKLWSLLELLTDTVGGGYDDTVRRAVFPFEDRDKRHAQVLSMLRCQRNRHVHHGALSEDPEASLYLLKRYVEQLLLFHLYNHFGFASIVEAGEFLALPKNKGELRKQRKRLDDAIKFQK